MPQKLLMGNEAIATPAGRVSGNDYVGGLVGGGKYIPIDKCYTVSTVTAAGESGPLVGGWGRMVRPQESYFESRGSDEKDNGRIIGLGKTTELMKQKKTFAGWDFGKTWGISGAVNNGYPYLLGMPVISAAEKSGEIEADEAAIGITGKPKAAEMPERLRGSP